MAKEKSKWEHGPDSKEKYNLYLASREWNVLRELVAVRSDGICERCHHNKMDHVHHLTYERKYCELPEDLQAICKGCHDFTHAKSNDDPLLKATVRYHGFPIRNVYLAGKITGTTWRDQLVGNSKWSHENHGLLDDAIEVDSYGNRMWKPIPNALSLPGDPRALAMTGPWWIPRHGGGHGFIGDNHNWHAGCDSTVSTSVNVKLAIQASDMIFAWIDSLDCYGTIAEIAMTYNTTKRVIVAVPSNFDRSELWLMFRLVDEVIEMDTPCDSPVKAAWDKVWSRELKQHYV